MFHFIYHLKSLLRNHKSQSNNGISTTEDTKYNNTTDIYYRSHIEDGRPASTWKEKELLNFEWVF